MDAFFLQKKILYLAPLIGMLNSIIKQYLKTCIPAIQAHYKEPENMQDRVFRELIASGVFTRFGREYGFSSIRSYEQFRRYVPIQNYDSLKGYIEQMILGKSNILWPGEVKWFAKTSGSAEDRSKLIPVSKQAMQDNHFKAGKDVLAIYAQQRPQTKLFTGKSMILGGSKSVHHLNAYSKVGDLSAVLLSNLSPVADYFRTPKRSIALMDDWNVKLDKMVEALSTVNVTNISGVPSWMLVLMKRLIEYKKADSILDIWPNLELFAHGAVKFDPYKAQFRELIPRDDFFYLETYNASEGFFAIQDEFGRSDMLLMLNYGIFYEFIPMDQLDNPSAAISLFDVKPGVNYAMLISTNSGLWRYMIGDTVKFTSLYPFRIEITGRTKHFINAFGEELMIENSEKAIYEACRASGATIVDYTAAPVFMSESGTGAHEWLIEFENEPVDLQLFATVLDSTLKELNSDYDAKRGGNLTLRFPIVRKLNAGTFHKWLASKGKLGGQHKVPRLSNDRKYVDEILNLA